MQKLKRGYVLLFSALFLSSGLFSQIAVTFGKEFPLEKRGGVDVTAATKSLLIAEHTYRSGLRMAQDFYRFDINTLSFQGVFNPIQKNSEIDENDYFTALTIKNKVFLFYDVYNSKTDKYTLYALPLGDDAKPAGSFIKIVELDASKRSNKGNYKIIASKDSSKICVIASPPYQKNTNERLIVSTFDNTLKNLTTCQVTLDYKDSKFIPGKFILSNDGDLLMQATVYVEKKDREKGDPKSYPTIFKISTKDGKLDEYQIKVQGMNLDDIDFTVDENNKVLCAGFYGDPTKGKRTDIDGIFYLRINKGTKTIEKTSYKPLPDDIVEELIGERKAKKGRGISNDFEINYFAARPNGNTVLLGQKYYVTVTSSYDPKTKRTTTYYHYHYQGPIAINIDKNGEITWAKMLPMKQVFTTSGGSSVGFGISFTSSFYTPPAPPFGGYALAQTKDKIYLLFNDHKQNREKNITSYKAAKTLTGGKSMIPAVAEMDAAGNFTVKQAFDAKTEKAAYVINTQQVINLQNNVLLCSLQSQGKFFRTCFNLCTCGLVPLNRTGRFAKLTFK
jgi:hypothetical protein